MKIAIGLFVLLFAWNAKGRRMKESKTVRKRSKFKHRLP